jgi:hypothetical protein
MPTVPMPVAPKQITYPNVAIDVQPLPDGNLMLVIQAPGETLIFPMGGEYAAALGHKLTAPHIVPATNGHGPPIQGARPR